MSVEVLYIAGAGKSGSTLLSLMLSQHDQIFNIGQIRDLPDAAVKSRACSCHSPVPQCSFWGQVVGRLTQAYGPEALTRISTGLEAFGAASRAEMRWGLPMVRAALRDQQAPFLEHLGALYCAAAQEAKGRMLVDSSKSVDLALALTLVPDVTVRILNLVRDPRAVAVSWSKVLKQPKTVQRRTRNWAGRQKRLDVLREINPEGYMAVRYEDLTVDPHNWIARIQDWAGVAQDLSVFTGPDRAALSWDRAHLFRPANATVLAERKEVITIAPAQSWRDPQNVEIHKMAERLSFPTAERFGYQQGSIGGGS